MPKQKEYEDALGSVFDFIFTEAQKSPNKVKPVKVKNPIDGRQEYVDAIVATLENPLLFVNKTTTGALENIMNVDIEKIALSKYKRDSVRFRLLDVKNVLNNDMASIDKQFNNIETVRKMGVLSWGGQEIASMIGREWARKQGLDFDTQEAIANVGKSASARAEQKEIANIRTKKLAQQHFSDSRNHLSERDYITRYKHKFEIMGSSPTVAAGLARDEYRNKYLHWVDIYNKANPSSGIGKDSNAERKLASLYENSSFYGFLERENLMNKAVEARRNGNTEEEEKLVKAAGFVEALNNRGYAEKYILREKKTIKNYTTRLRALEALGDPAYDDDIKRIKKSISVIKSNLRFLARKRSVDSLGQIEGMYNSVKGVWGYIGDGQLLPAILTGDFFDEEKNRTFLRPTENTFVTMFGKDNAKKQIDIRMAIKSNNRILAAYNQSMTNLYYMTPAALINNLTTGETFAYWAHRAQERILSRFAGKGIDLDMEQLFSSTGEAYISSLGLDPKSLEMITNFIKSNKNLQNLAINFSKIGDLRKKIASKLNPISRFGIDKKVRQWIFDKFFKNIANETAKGLLESWVSNGGIRVVIEGLKTSLKALIASYTGPLAIVLNRLVDLLGIVAMKVAGKIMRPIAKLWTQILVFSTIGIVGIMFLLLAVVFPSILGQYAHVAPAPAGGIVQCDPNYTVYPADGGDIFFSPYPGMEVPVFDGNIQEIFDQVAASMGVSYSLELIDTSDYRYTGGAWWCISSTPIYCKADKLMGASPEYLSRLFRHEIIHQIQGSGYDYTIGEWGADLLSGNGGSYVFSLNGVRVRATETRDYFLAAGCTEQELEDLALCKPGSKTSSCGNIVISSITNLGIGNP